MRSVGNVALNFGLLNVPVKIFAATSDHKTEFHQFHQHADGSTSRVQQVLRCAACASDVARGDLVRGVERGDDVVLVTDDELAGCETRCSGPPVLRRVVPVARNNGLAFER